MSYIPEPTKQVETMTNHRMKLLVGMAVLFVALGYFAFLAFKESTVYYVTVSELSQQGVPGEGKFVRVSGKLIPDSYHRDPEGTLATFALTDEGDLLDARYDGALPSIFFNEHSEIILEGAYSADQVFDVNTVIVKCPSKYVALEEEQQAS